MKAPPAYQALREQLRDEIDAGQYRNGARLPTESELVARHRLSRQTVRRAFQDLVAEGVVYRVPGRGTYAHGDSRRYLRQLYVDPMTAQAFTPLLAPQGGIWGVASSSSRSPIRATVPPR